MFNRFRNFRVYNAFKGLQKSNSLRSNTFKANLINQAENNSAHNKGFSTTHEEQTNYKQIFQENKEKVIQSTKDFMNLVIQATKDAYSDAKYLSSVSSTKPKKDYTVEEIVQTQRIKKDLVKFVPYYAAMVLPGGAIAILLIRALFPRGTPTYFMSQDAMNKQHAKYLENQAKAHGPLMDYLLAAMEKEGYNASNRNPEEIKKFFVEHQDALLKTLSTGKMSTDMIKNASDFLMFEYVEGSYIINAIYRTVVNFPRYAFNLGMWATGNSYRAVWTHPFFNYQFKLNSFLFKNLKERLIRRQFDKQLRLLKAENYAMASNSFGEMKQEDYLQVSQERGHIAQSEEDAKKWIKVQWIPMVKDNVDSEMFAFWCSVIHYSYHKKI